jgi:MFS family permease
MNSIAVQLTRMRVNRWVSLEAGIWLMLISGSIYLVPVYSADLKQALGFDQTQINLVTTATSVGAWVSLPAGLFLDRFGFRLSALVGAVLLFAGYMLLSLAASGALPTRSAGVVALFTFIAGQGVGFTYMTSLKANASNFPPALRGRAVGVLVTFFGLSSGVFGLVGNAFFGDHSVVAVVSFLQFLAVALALVAVVGGLLNNHVPSHVPLERHSSVRLWGAYGIAGVLVAYVTLSAVLTRAAGVGASQLVWPVFVLLLPVFLLSVRAGRPFSLDTDEELLSAKDTELAEHTISLPPLPPTGADGFTIWQVLRNADFWLLFAMFMLAVGPGIMAQQNLPELVLSRANYTEAVLGGARIEVDDLPGNTSVASLLPLFSVFGAVGRMFAGFMMDRYGEPVRLLFIPLTSIIVSMVAFAFSPIDGFYFAMPALGFGYGQVFALSPVILIEEFGTANFGASWGLIGIAPALGALAANSVAGALNDMFTKDSAVLVVAVDSDDTVAHCVGQQCYAWAFGACVLSLALALGANGALWLRRRRRAQGTTSAGAYRPMEKEADD